MKRLEGWSRFGSTFFSVCTEQAYIHTYKSPTVSFNKTPKLLKDFVLFLRGGHYLWQPRAAGRIIWHFPIENLASIWYLLLYSKSNKNRYLGFISVLNVIGVPVTGSPPATWISNISSFTWPVYCRVPARHGLQRTTRAATRHWAREPLVRPQVDQTWKNKSHTWFALFLLRQGEPGTSQYISNRHQITSNWYEGKFMIYCVMLTIIQDPGFFLFLLKFSDNFRYLLIYCILIPITHSEKTFDNFWYFQISTT